MPYNPKSLKNLRPSTKENPSNPSGKPKGMFIWSYIKKHGDKSKEELIDIIKHDNTPARDVIAAQYLLKAMNGDIRATEYLVDREEGKPTSTTNVNQSIQGLQFIGQANMTDDMIKTISNTVKDSEQAKSDLMATMNRQLVGGTPPDGICDREEETTND